jgi:hypothetical protein
MTTYYWVGSGAAGTKNWRVSTYWSLTSGGAGGAGIPNSSTDDAYFDTNSPADRVRTSYTINTTIRDLNTVGWTGTFYSGDAVTSLRVFGNITLGSGTIWEMNSGATNTRAIITMESTGNQTIQTNGSKFNVALTITSGITKLLDDWTSDAQTNVLRGASLVGGNGTFDADGYNVNITLVNWTNTTGAVYLRSGTWTINGASTVNQVWRIFTQLTYPGTSTVKFTGDSVIFTSPAEQTTNNSFYNLTFDGPANATYRWKTNGFTSRVVNNFTVTTPAPCTINMEVVPSNVTTWQFDGNVTINGTPSNYITLKSFTNEYFYMNNNSGSNKTLTYAAIANFYGSNGSWTGDYCNNLGRNVNITFTNSFGGSFMSVLVA